MENLEPSELIVETQPTVIEEAYVIEAPKFNYILKVIHIGLTKNVKRLTINTDLVAELLNREDNVANLNNAIDKTVHKSILTIVLDYRELTERMNYLTQPLDPKLVKLLTKSKIDVMLGTGIADANNGICYVPINGLRNPELVARHELTHLIHSTSNKDLAFISAAYGIPLLVTLLTIIMTITNNVPQDKTFILMALTLITLSSAALYRMAPVEADAINAEKTQSNIKLFT